MRILNLGCGTKVSAHPDIINIDWSIYLRLKRIPVIRAVVPRFLRGIRRQRYENLPPNIVVHNLANGIPFPDATVDVVYHSHLLEHLDRSAARGFLQEAQRVLKPGGIHRIVVPDLERAARAYLAHLTRAEQESPERERHDDYIAAMIEQCVRVAAAGTSQQPRLWRILENLLRGDARRRGETHQWMYDRVNLSALLSSLGYQHPVIQRFDTSLIPGWNDYGLDCDEQGHEYKLESLYLEART